ncbi:hypothetical protein [Halococcus sediminicola]|uniref:hypothetical protein n=1 Tax=Halococcus sediminicola TaxID=1264579 RepID=UPI000678B4AC|nr:hypothetical protein [Halococcus sediminicola]
MSFDEITASNSDGDERDDEPTVESLAARVRDLEADVYGFADDEQAAGQEAVVDVKRTIVFLDNRLDEDRRVSGVPVEDVFRIAGVLGLSESVVKQAYNRLKRHGEIYEPAIEEVRAT